MISKVMSNPGPKHTEFLLHMAGYLKRVADKPLLLKRNRRLYPDKAIALWGYCDADYAGCVDTRRSMTGYCIFADGILLATNARIQPSVTLSTTAAEFMALVAIITMLLWTMSFYKELGFAVKLPVVIYCDNQSAIYVAEGATTNFKQSRHIDIRYMYIKEILKQGDIEVMYVRSEGNIADIMTKAIPKARFIKLRDLLLGAVIAVQEAKAECLTSLKEIFDDFL